MRSLLPRPSTRRLATLTAWTAGVVVLTPMILVAGLVAVVALTALTLSRQAGRTMSARRRPATALGSVLRLEVAPAESSLGVLNRHAA